VLAILGHAGAYFAGRQDEGLQRLQPLLRNLDIGAPSPGVAALTCTVGALLYAVGRYGEAVPVFERAAALARALRDDHLLVEAETRRGKALQLLGQGEEALRVLEEILPRAETLGSPILLFLCLHHLAAVARDRGEFAACRNYAERGLVWSERVQDSHFIAVTTWDRGMSAFYTGDWQQARLDIEQAVTLTRPHGTPLGAYLLLHLGLLCLVEGMWDDAVEYLEEGNRVAGADLEARRLAQGMLAERDLLAGEPGAARDRILPLLDQPGLQEWTVTGLLPVLAWAQLELGEVEEAALVIGQAVVRARAQHMRIALVDALRVRAMVALRRGEPEEAARSLDEGLTLARCMPYPYAEARLLQVYGREQTQPGNRSSGRERLEAALAIFQRLGARKDVERTEQWLAAHC
jgi:tetratricopeptide (TPR) repeat protein